MKTNKIQIAPNLCQVKLTNKYISTTWHTKPRYNADLKTLRKRLGDKNIKEAFCLAIAMSSYDWQVEYLLNENLKLNGYIDHINA